MRQPVIRPTCGSRSGEGSFASRISCYGDLKIGGKDHSSRSGEESLANWKRGGMKLGKWEKLFQRNEV